MSAPRKIWADKASMGWVEAYPGQQMNPCEEIYHHDDVVRELMEYVGHKRNCALMRAFIDGKVCTCGFDAALAKIAQEG